MQNVIAHVIKVSQKTYLSTLDRREHKLELRSSGTMSILCQKNGNRNSETILANKPIKGEANISYSYQTQVIKRT